MLSILLLFCVHDLFETWTFVCHSLFLKIIFCYHHPFVAFRFFSAMIIIKPCFCLCHLLTQMHYYSIMFFAIYSGYGSFFCVFILYSASVYSFVYATLLHNNSQPHLFISNVSSHKSTKYEYIVELHIITTSGKHH